MADDEDETQIWTVVSITLAIVYMVYCYVRAGIKVVHHAEVWTSQTACEVTEQH